MNVSEAVNRNTTELSLNFSHQQSCNLFPSHFGIFPVNFKRKEKKNLTSNRHELSHYVFKTLNVFCFKLPTLLVFNMW